MTYAARTVACHINTPLFQVHLNSRNDAVIGVPNASGSRGGDVNSTEADEE